MSGDVRVIRRRIRRRTGTLGPFLMTEQHMATLRWALRVAPVVGS